MTRFGLLAFLTDYGQRDGFVAACHGVLARLAPHARVLDVSHEVPPYDVRHGAAVLARVAPYLPPAVYVGVVDPGVGTPRRGIVVRAGDSLLVGPDNGLLLPAAQALGGVEAAHAITEEALFLRSRSATFDGRDVFSPVAAHLAGGGPPESVGPVLATRMLATLPDPYRRVADGVLECEVTYVDRYGNVQLAATPADLPRGAADATWAVAAAGSARPVAVGRAFGDVAPGELVLYTDADGRLALAVNRGSAAAGLRLRAGCRVRLSRAGSVAGSGRGEAGL